jgi:hypothetical protein
MDAHLASALRDDAVGEKRRFVSLRAAKGGEAISWLARNGWIASGLTPLAMTLAVSLFSILPTTF